MISSNRFMSKEGLDQKYEYLRKDPEYRKDFEELSAIGDDKLWRAKVQKMKERYGVEQFPSPTYDPAKRAREKIWPEQRTQGKHIPLEDFFRARVEGLKESDPIEVKEDFAEYQKRLKEDSKFEFPLTDEEVRYWEQLADSGEFKKLREEQIKKTEAWLTQNSAIVNELLHLDPIRRERDRKFMKERKIPHSPLLGFYSLTAWVVVRLCGIQNQELFGMLMRYISKRIRRATSDKSIDLAIEESQPVEATKLKAYKAIQDREEKLANAPYELLMAIKALSQVPKRAIEAVEGYLYRCVDNALKKEWRKEKKRGITYAPKYIEYRAIDVDTFRANPQSTRSLVEEAVKEIVFPDPVDRIIASNIGESDSKIAGIIEKATGKHMTRQAVQKRRTQRVTPLLKRAQGLEISMVRMDEEQRRGHKIVTEKTLEEILGEIASSPNDGLLLTEWVRDGLQFD